eukprot:TRINITY_DN15821_c0_g1_i1.p1 TRINITY_DN15821_c0_g1~~TRINITY_DN15821_c0_g1_i1.p1  ORF type:complete len:137 (+),score=25.63 TRINITY_DN15821_c0_g1_i1:92-502(+)
MATDPDCLFCKIVAGKIPCVKIHETEHALAFLDIFPLSEGHCLVIPKYHAEKLHQLPEAAMADVGPVLVKVAKAVGAENYNILQNNGSIAHQVVKHVHFHIIPKPNEEQGLGIQWPASKAETEALQAVAGTIKQRL